MGICAEALDRREDVFMKSNRRLRGLFTACCMTLCMTTAAIADPSVYDSTQMSGQGFSVADDGVTVTTKIYPGDRIANTEVYLGMDNLNADAAEGLFDMLDDGTPCWVNQTGRVYSVTSLPIDTGIEQMDEEGNPILDEAGNPVTMTDTAYVLETYGGIVETAYGISGTDSTDPNTGSSLKDTAYSLRGDQAYFYTDETGMPQTIYASDIDTAAYPNGTSVYLTYDTPADPSSVFSGWSVYRVQPDGSMAKVSDDQIGQLGIPELAGPGQLGADAVNAAGGRLYITVNGMNDHLVFVPVFSAAAPQPEETPDAVDPEADPNAADPYAAAPDMADPAADPALIDELAADAGGADVVQIGGDGADGLDAELDADAGIITDDEEPGYTYEVFVNYIDPEWNGESTGYYTYAGGEFSEEISTAQTNPEGLVFSEWSADSDEVIIEGKDNAQAVLKFDPSAVPTENKVINVAAVYTEPQTEKAVNELTLIDGSAETDVDLAQVEEGTQINVTAAQKSGLVFTGWTADGLELDDDQLSASDITITMPANAVTLTAQYRMETEAPTEKPTEAPEENQEELPAETPTEAPAEAQQENPEQEQTDAPQAEETVIQAEVLTAQNASIESDDAVENEDGSVSVTVEQGDTVTVIANDAPEGQEFAMWNITSEGDIETTDVTDEVLEVKVSENVTVEPVYAAEDDDEDDKDIEPSGEPESGDGQQSSEQESGDGQQSSEQESGEDQQSSEQESGDQQQSEESTQPDTDGQMEPQSDSEKEAPAFKLTVVSGSSDKNSLKEGETATLKANAPSKGYEFSSWTVSGSGSVANKASAQTTFTMGAADATVTANYTPVTYALTVKNGSGSGSYEYDEDVDITANYPESGKEFDSWVAEKGKVTFVDPSSYYGTLYMPASDATVKATYKNGPDPANNAITGLENGKEYLKGSTLTFTAVGAGMDKTGKNPGDYRYKPAGYQIGGVSGSWTSSPYTTSMAINAAGDYTLTVTYAKEVYDGSGWHTDGTTVTKSVTFHIVTAMSVNTGDPTPLGLFIAAGVAALAVIIALIIVLIRRRNR